VAAMLDSSLRVKLILLVIFLVFLMLAGFATGIFQENWAASRERKEAAESVSRGYSRWPYEIGDDG
jgi:hypothetical protein